VDQATFRVVRDAIYREGMGTGPLVGIWRREGLPWEGCTVEDFVARRRLYLSIAFYTGLREADLDALDDRCVSADLGYYRRSSRKTGDDLGFLEKCPAQLRADLEYERRRLGRPYREGEKIAGGPWPSVARVLRAACIRVGVPPFNVMDLRRSFAYHLAIAGVSEATTTRLMSHKDSRMVRTVYRQFPVAGERDDAGRFPEMTTPVPGTSTARIVSITTGGPVACHSVAKSRPNCHSEGNLNARNIK
jgi:integrase